MQPLPVDKRRLPVVMSWNALGLAYKKGFKKPRGLLLYIMRASLMRAMVLAKIGLEQLVPSTDWAAPPTMI